MLSARHPPGRFAFAGDRTYSDGLSSSSTPPPPPPTGLYMSSSVMVNLDTFHPWTFRALSDVGFRFQRKDIMLVGGLTACMAAAFLYIYNRCWDLVWKIGGLLFKILPGLFGLFGWLGITVWSWIQMWFQRLLNFCRQHRGDVEALEAELFHHDADHLA